MRQLVKINLIFIAFLVIVAYTPIMRLFFPPIAVFIVGLFCFVLSILTSNSTIVIFNKQTLFWFIIYIWQFLCFLTGHSDASINYIIVRFLVYQIPILVPYIFFVCNYKEKRFIATVIFITVFANIVYNVFYGMQHPELYEYSGQISDNFKIVNNISDTILATCSVFFVPLCYIITRNTSKKVTKVTMWVAMFADVFLLLFVIQRATALIVLITEFAVLILVDKGVKYKHSLIIGAVVIVSAFFMLGTSWGNTFLSWFEGSEILTYRFTQVVDFAQSGEVDESTFSGRLSLSTLSINTFFGGVDSFLIGVGEDENIAETAGLESSGVGHHSEFFDLAARYGIIGIFLMFMALSRTFKFIISNCSNRNLIDRIRIVFLFYIIYSFLNNTLNTEVFYLLFMFMPIVIWLLDSHYKFKYYV